jgi:hypothetical protein
LCKSVSGTLPFLSASFEDAVIITLTSNNTEFLLGEEPRWPRPREKGAGSSRSRIEPKTLQSQRVSRIPYCYTGALLAHDCQQIPLDYSRCPTGCNGLGMSAKAGCQKKH